MPLSPGGFEREQRVVTGQRLQVANRKRQLERIKQDVDQAQLIHVQVIMWSVATNHKRVSRHQFVAVFAGDMNAFAAGDDGKLGELMAMQAKWLLWVTSFDHDRKSVGVKPVLLFQRRDHLGHVSGAVWTGVLARIGCAKKTIPGGTIVLLPARMSRFGVAPPGRLRKDGPHQMAGQTHAPPLDQALRS